MSALLPYGLPYELWDTVEEWLNGLVDRGIVDRRPGAEHMTVGTSGPLTHRLHVHTHDDIYAWADVETVPHPGQWTARVVSEGWGNYDPVHDSDRPDCRCEECECDKHRPRRPRRPQDGRTRANPPPCPPASVEALERASTAVTTDPDCRCEERP